MNELHKLLEALIFSSEQPITAAELQTILFTYSGEEVSLEAIQEHVDALQTKYESDDYVFEIVKTGGGYQFLSKPYYHKPITTLLQHRAKRKLSVAALECLSMIAYSQPITKIEIRTLRPGNLVRHELENCQISRVQRCLACRSTKKWVGESWICAL